MKCLGSGFLHGYKAVTIEALTKVHDFGGLTLSAIASVGCSIAIDRFFTEEMGLKARA